MLSISKSQVRPTHHHFLGTELGKHALAAKLGLIEVIESASGARHTYLTLRYVNLRLTKLMLPKPEGSTFAVRRLTPLTLAGSHSAQKMVISVLSFTLMAISLSPVPRRMAGLHTSFQRNKYAHRTPIFNRSICNVG
jgi:hypothetical protein